MAREDEASKASRTQDEASEASGWTSRAGSGWTNRLDEDPHKGWAERSEREKWRANWGQGPKSPQAWAWGEKVRFGLIAGGPRCAWEASQDNKWEQVTIAARPKPEAEQKRGTKRGREWVSVGHSVVLSAGRQWATEETIALSQTDLARLEAELGSWSQERVRLRWFRRTEEDRLAEIKKATQCPPADWRTVRWGNWQSVQSPLEGRLGGGRG